VVSGGVARGGGPGQWWIFKAAALISCAVAAVLWGRGRGTAWFWMAVLVLRGRRGRRPGLFIVELCEGRPGCYVGAAAPKAWCLGGDLEICVDIEFADLAGSSSDNAEFVRAGKSGRRPRT
jgi:hypothetical protein